MTLLKNIILVSMTLSAVGFVHANDNNADLGYEFHDCNHQVINTKDVLQDKQNAKNVDCILEGILNTKFDVNGSRQNFKSVKEMTEKERESIVDKKALFVLGFYDYLQKTKK